jgi:hypothetical protein
LAPLLDSPTAKSRQIEEQFKALEIMRGGISDPLEAAAKAVIAGLQACGA